LYVAQIRSDIDFDPYDVSLRIRDFPLGYLKLYLVSYRPVDIQISSVTRRLYSNFETELLNSELRICLPFDITDIRN
jgi:hypothetical protein